MRSGVADALERIQAPLLQLSLHRRIAVFVSSILLAVFVAFGYLGWAAIGSGERMTLDERADTAQVLARHLDTFLGHATSHLAVLAREVAPRTGVLTNDDAGHSLADSYPQLQLFFRRLLVVDTNGHVIASEPAGTLDTVSSEAREVVDSALRQRSPTISNLVELHGDSARGVFFVAPIISDRTPVGAVVGEMQLPHPAIYAVASALQLGKTGHMEVVDAHGVVLASTLTEDVFDESEHLSFYAPLLASHASTVGPALYEHHADEDGEHEEMQQRATADSWHTMAFVPLDSTGWGVGIGQTEAETFAAGRDLRNQALAVAAGALGLALCFAWIGTRSVVLPLRQLTEAGERMAAGDLSQTIPVEQSDEVGRLAHVMEFMRQRLGGSLAEIRAWNTELERRVHDRTRALETSNRHLQVLTHVATAAGRGQAGLEAALQSGLEELASALDSESGWASLWDEQHQHLRLVASYKLSDDMLNAERVVDCADATCIACIQAEEPLRANLNSCAALPFGLRRTMPDTSCWSAPIRLGDEVLGRLFVTTLRDRALNADELALLEGVARQLAVAFDNARLVEEAARLETVRRMDLLRAEFLGSVSHELRTPLGFVKGYSTTLLREDVRWTKEQQREFLHIIDEECDHLTGLVDDLLDAARLQAGRLRFTFAPVDVGLLVKRVVDRMSTTTLAQRPVEVQLAEVPSIVADASRVEQVVLNLLQNACRYSPAGTPITIELQPDAEGVRIGVLDRGVGLAGTDAERVFEPFYRTRNGASAHAGGAGLGLAICRSIVEHHSGRMWAETRPGGGTAMWLTLPFEPRPTEGEQLHARVAREASLSR